MLVQRLGGEVAALLQKEFIESGQNRRVESHRILNKHNQLHTHIVHIVLHIHEVLKQLDDCHQKVDVAQPAEHKIHAGEIFLRQAAAHFARKRREHHIGYVGVASLDFARTHKGLADVDARHGYHQVVVLAVECLQCLGNVHHLREARRRTEVERRVFKIYLFLKASVVLQHKRIVGRCHQQHIEYAPLHQVAKRRVLQIELTK